MVIITYELVNAWPTVDWLRCWLSVVLSVSWVYSDQDVNWVTIEMMFEMMIEGRLRVLFFTHDPIILSISESAIFFYQGNKKFTVTSSQTICTVTCTMAHTGSYRIVLSYSFQVGEILYYRSLLSEIRYNINLGRIDWLPCAFAFIANIKNSWILLLVAHCNVWNWFKPGVDATSITHLSSFPSARVFIDIVSELVSAALLYSPYLV